MFILIRIIHSFLILRVWHRFRDQLTQGIWELQLLDKCIEFFEKTIKSIFKKSRTINVIIRTFSWGFWKTKKNLPQQQQAFKLIPNKPVLPFHNTFNVHEFLQSEATVFPAIA